VHFKRFSYIVVLCGNVFKFDPPSFKQQEAEIRLPLPQLEQGLLNTCIEKAVFRAP